MRRLIGISNLVRRQTKDSRFSFFDGSWDGLAALVERHFDRAQPGYKDGVLLVPVPAEQFFSGVVRITSETMLKATFTARREGEEPYVQLVAVGGEKLPAKAVDIVIYRHDVLGDDASTDAQWEIVSINARPTEEPEPLTPTAMMRNMLELPGGTRAVYTAQEFALATRYWSQHAMCGD